MTSGEETDRCRCWDWEKDFTERKDMMDDASTKIVGNDTVDYQLSGMQDSTLQDTVYPGFSLEDGTN